MLSRVNWPDKRVSIFAAAAAITSILYINFCATIFHCGCASLWSGADAHCNVHLPSVRHCPWCVYGRAASLIPYGAIVAVQAAIAFSRRPMPAVRRLISAVAAFPIAGAAIGLIYGLATGYWR